MNRSVALIAALAAAGVASSAWGAVANITITADNHYALYTDVSGVTYVGGNELGAGGAPGQYNWSEAETYLNVSFGQTLYIAAWSDDSVAQGLLAQIVLDDSTTLHSGNAAWEVYATGQNRGDNDPHPTSLEIAGHVAAANGLSKWETPYVGPSNGSAPSPWGGIAGIDSAARWTWWNTPGDSNPLDGGSGAGEMLIFRITAVPAPGAAALAGMGLLMVARRKR